MSTILILGSSGLFGSSLVPVLDSSSHIVFTQSRTPGFDLTLDPLNSSALATCLDQIKPDIIINLIAATNVDLCERSPQWAFNVNVLTVSSLVSAVKMSQISTHLIHISTDQLYDGNGPHKEHTIRPCNVYGLPNMRLSCR